jgi:hypothetical protein
MTRLKRFFSVFLSFAIREIEAKVKSLLVGVYFEGLFMVQSFKVAL